MSLLRYSLLVCICFILLLSCNSHRDKKVLVFFDTQNEQIANGLKVIQDIGSAENFAIDTTSKATSFTEENLKNYSAVVFMNVPGESLNIRQQTNLERFVQSGGGYVGINPAINLKYNWPWYEQLIHQATEAAHIADQEYADAQLTSTAEGKNANGIESWEQEVNEGRAFIMKGSHVSPALSSPEEKELFTAGLIYAIGDNQLDYEQATSLAVPEANRFVKHTLVPGPLDEPTELAVLPDGKVIFTQRKGEVQMYYPLEDQFRTIAKLDVHTRYEDGLLGIAKDPDFYRNHWIYMYYSPAGDEPVQHLSRFLLLNDSLILSSEKVILEVPVQRQECCHTGGSIAFGPDGNLFLSTGDNTNPFMSDGYAPIDERPGRAPFDAQGSSGNTNDLRGKILRIKVNADATYSIPDGNLFPKDGSGGRPEIFVMGLRNPYRISVDQKTGWLYWGDVGPDAKVPSEKGPQGYDAIKQAKKPGNYGWPYFRGNKPYRDFDFATGELGDYFNPEAPVNNSPNNTGAKILPPFQKSFVWYPYDSSSIFPIVETGGRNAMAGPVFHYDMYPHAEHRFPEYYDGKLFMYDWMRNWIIAATMDEEGNLTRLEPFLDSIQFNKIIDMEMAQDGSIYFLEYGDDWFSANPNASLSRIEYSEGNRAPIASLTTDKTVGAAPLKVTFSSEGTFDYDANSELSYEWFFTEEDNPQSTEANPQFTFDKPGIYEVKMRAYDEEGDADEKSLTIQVGNDQPDIQIALQPNSTFYWPNETVNYHVIINDKEDGSTTSGSITHKDVNFNIDYVSAVNANAAGDMGHKLAADGLSLIENSGCIACHSFEKKSVGPAYQEVAKKYAHDDATSSKLVQKILNGGGGVWGDRVMPAQAVTQAEAETIVDYILSLDEKGAILPLKGSFVADKADGNYILSVQYTDKGGDIVGPLTIQEQAALRFPIIQAEQSDSRKGTREETSDSNVTYIGNMRDSSYIVFDSIDMTNIKSLTLKVAATSSDYGISVRAGSQDGKELGSVNLPDTQSETNWKEVVIPISSQTGKQQLFFVVNGSKSGDNKAEVSLDWIRFNKSATASKAVAVTK